MSEHSIAQLLLRNPRNRNDLPNNKIRKSVTYIHGAIRKSQRGKPRVILRQYWSSSKITPRRKKLKSHRAFTSISLPSCPAARAASAVKRPALAPVVQTISLYRVSVVSGGMYAENGIAPSAHILAALSVPFVGTSAGTSGVRRSPFSAPAKTAGGRCLYRLAYAPFVFRGTLRRRVTRRISSAEFRRPPSSPCPLAPAVRPRRKNPAAGCG